MNKISFTKIKQVYQFDVIEIFVASHENKNFLVAWNNCRPCTFAEGKANPNCTVDIWIAASINNEQFKQIVNKDPDVTLLDIFKQAEELYRFEGYAEGYEENINKITFGDIEINCLPSVDSYLYRDHEEDDM